MEFFKHYLRQSLLMEARGVPAYILVLAALIWWPVLVCAPPCSWPTAAAGAGSSSLRHYQLHFVPMHAVEPSALPLTAPCILPCQYIFQCRSRSLVLCGSSARTKGTERSASVTRPRPQSS
ncbi:hypothetical protein BC834DRAFT_675073 [Gloeopeniophorella convolvens]|nr:hypothetical protein BC834DRAFT_675073 [Gloeopeniophorella convolvens]